MLTTIAVKKRLVNDRTEVYLGLSGNDCCERYERWRVVSIWSQLVILKNVKTRFWEEAVKKVFIGDYSDREYFPKFWSFESPIERK